MSSSPSLPESNEEEARYNNICEKYKNLTETMPKGNGWWSEHLYNYNGFWLHPLIMKNYLVLSTDFKPQPTDIFLASSLKSGTTWLKALMFSTLNRHHYSFSNHHLHNHTPQSTFPFIDSESYPFPDFTTLPVPRLFATHFAYTLLPTFMSSCKFVYVCRDPKDVFISMWHFMSNTRSKDLPPISFDDAFESFCHGVFDYGPIWEHVLSYWRASLESPDKILFLKYEEIKKQPETEVRKLGAFMGKPFTEEEEKEGVVGEIVKLCSFNSLSNLEVNKKGVEKFGKVAEIKSREFFRKGEVGDWENYLSEEMKQRIDRITEEKLQGSGLILTTTS